MFCLTRSGRSVHQRHIAAEMGCEGLGEHLRLREQPVWPAHDCQGERLLFQIHAEGAHQDRSESRQMLKSRLEVAVVVGCDRWSVRMIVLRPMEKP